MKKIFSFLLIGFIICLSASSQVTTLNLKDKYQYEYTGVTADLLDDSLETISKVFAIDANEPVYATVQVSLTVVSGTPSSSWVLYGSMDGGTTLQSLGTGSTKSFNGASNDSKFILAGGTSTKTDYRRGSADTTTFANKYIVFRDTITVSYFIPINYTSLVVKGTNSTSADVRISKIYIKLSKYKRED